MHLCRDKYMTKRLCKIGLKPDSWVNANIARKHIDTDLLKTEASKGCNNYLSDLKSECKNGTKLL
jgi:hypothetical protein